MIGYLLNSIGLATVTTYATINYLTYKTININIIENKNMDRLDFKPVYLSPTFNYHHQLQKQLASNCWSYITLRPTSFKIKDNIFQMINFNMEVDEQRYKYSYKFGNYSFSFGTGYSTYD